MTKKNLFCKLYLVILITLCCYRESFARAGGGGGGGHSSGGGHSYGGSHGLSFGSGSSGGYGANLTVVILVVIGLVIYYLVKGKYNSNGDEDDPFIPDSPPLFEQPLPEGLDTKKVHTAFMNIQEAWQKKDLEKVRKWISDGVYQRFTAQFAMMNKLAQVNNLSNISISYIRFANAGGDGHYQTADVAIRFKMDDEFVSSKYPSFDQSFYGESAMEYWTFIKRTDGANNNLYDNNNCPNCGAPFELKMGEISRCSGCGTLTNNAAYDWVLSEITQEDDYIQNRNLQDEELLLELTKNDDLFSIQRIEDVASNVFMQVMEVMSGAPEKKLSRFADEATATSIMESKKQSGDFIFDRLYLNRVDLVNFFADSERLNLNFSLKATYQRLQPGEHLKKIDAHMITQTYKMVLSKNIHALQTAEKETVFSYECAKCGAPYSDTTNAVCDYCSAPLIDFNRNWVLTYFSA